MNYREAWVNGEIEAGTLVDRIQEQALTIEKLEAGIPRLQEQLYQARAELAALKAQPSGVVLPDELTDEMRNSMAYVPGLSDTTMQDLLWLALKLARLNRSASAGVYNIETMRNNAERYLFLRDVAGGSWGCMIGDDSETAAEKDASIDAEIARLNSSSASADDERAARVNDWFLSLPPERQAVLRDDKWLLADAAFIAGQARAVLSANHSEQVPDGWKLVPVESTGLMEDAAGIGMEKAREVYRAMLTAAPSAGSQKEQGE